MMSSADEDVDINAALDAVALTEESVYSKSYAEGYEKGKLEVVAQGWTLGVNLGSQLGIELGTYRGYCNFVMQTTSEKQQPNYLRIITLCEKILKAVENFPPTNIGTEDLLQTAAKIRAQFKMLKTTLGMIVKEEDIEEVKQSFSF